MGQHEINPALKSVPKINLSCFKFIKKIGKGSYGRVWKVIDIKKRHSLALKEISKAMVLKYGLSKEVFAEKEILSKLYHPFIINMYTCFQDSDNLYMILDYSPYKDLRCQYKYFDLFKEDEIKFISCCMILALNYIHQNKIIHKDIKPENLLFDDKGYLRLTDFGISKYIHTNERGVPGTFGYFSPEALENSKMGYESDYFTMGIVLYELTTCKRPYDSICKEELKRRFKEEKLKTEPIIKLGYSSNLADFLIKLLEVDPEQRLGHKGIDEIANHPWLNETDWKHIHYKSLKSPFLGRIEFNSAEKEDMAYCTIREITGPEENENKSTLSSSNNKESNGKNIFENYNFVHFVNPKQFVLFGNGFNTIEKGISLRLASKRGERIIINAEGKEDKNLKNKNKNISCLISPNKKLNKFDSWKERTGSAVAVSKINLNGTPIGRIQKDLPKKINYRNKLNDDLSIKNQSINQSEKPNKYSKIIKMKYDSDISSETIQRNPQDIQNEDIRKIMGETYYQKYSKYHKDNFKTITKETQRKSIEKYLNNERKAIIHNSLLESFKMPKRVLGESLLRNKENCEERKTPIRKRFKQNSQKNLGSYLRINKDKVNLFQQISISPKKEK
ncbi:MAG: serine/threonine-protein kinase [archaeon]|nr:serine/threonine-protein kinase [archaeon]